MDEKQNKDLYSYEYDYDNLYCYKDSIVLKNKLNIKDKDKFFKAEREITSLRTTQSLVNPIKGNFDEDHLKAIHRFLFSDIYEWAGEIRTINISKGNSFCQALYIEDFLKKLFKELKNESYLDNLPKEELIKRLSYYLGEINAIHAFREGNGRTQRLFVTYLARRQGYDLQFANVEPQQMIDASYNSFLGDYELLDNLIASCLVKRDDEE